ncbi:MAG: hypothetical protein SGPRY_010519, partial [Prymnesium sp.]
MAVPVVLVLGDVGRSPRMQYHALSLARHSRRVLLVEAQPDITQVLMTPDILPRPKHRLLRLLSLPLKAIGQLVQLLYTLLLLPQPSLILVQNPPAIPSLLAVWLISQLRGCNVIVDWHNLGYSVLQHSLGSSHPLVRISKVYERLLGRALHGHLCVTRAMASFLERQWGVPAHVLYDRPPSFFRRLDVDQVRAERRHECDRSCMHSFPQNEDFSILLDSLAAFDLACINSVSSGIVLVAVITGKGPQKAAYEKTISSMRFSHVAIATMWLEAMDYPKLLGSADLGVSLHTSTSGLDLPMKVLDMFGSGLPVCAVGFNCISELVQHGVNGVIFHSREELTSQLITYLMPNSEATKTLDHLREGVTQTESQRLRWEANWDEAALPLLRSPALARSPRR